VLNGVSNDQIGDFENLPDIYAALREKNAKGESVSV
jgi:hypothetical protein